MYNIMIIDDDVYIGDMLEETLGREGYSVTRAYSGGEAKLLLECAKPDLILLDLMLPGMSGEELLGEISGIPVIVVSAKNDVSDRVRLLYDGAVDYVTKPFNTSELLARIEVQRRRPNENASRVTAGRLTLDVAAHTVSTDSASEHLTRTEFAILRLLMQNPKQVITKSKLLDRISVDTPHCVESSHKVHISNLRRKLRNLTGQNCIDAVWGIGFKFAENA